MKRLMRPIVLTPSPSPVEVLLGGLVGTILLTSWLFAGPALGWPFVDIPHAFGGVFTSRSALAFGIGYALFFVGGTGIFSFAILAVWSIMPGSETGLAGAFLKGVLWGIAGWIVTGVALGMASALNRLDSIAPPGWFAANTGLWGVTWLFLGCLAYGVALAIVGAVEHGITALDTLGWTGYYHAATGPTWLDEHRSLDVPQPGDKGTTPWHAS
jgi:hypothetical protein